MHDLIWNYNIWNRAFQLYLDQAQSAKPKSSRQLLASLTKALKKGSHHNISTSFENCTESLLLCLVGQEDPFRAKASVQFLSNLLIKDIISVDDVLAAYHKCIPPNNELPRQHNIGDFFAILFRWLNRDEIASSIAQLASHLLDKIEHDKQTPLFSNASLTAPIWASALESVSSKEYIKPKTLRAHVLPILFKRKFEDLVAALYSFGLQHLVPGGRTGYSGSELEYKSKDDLLYAALETGKDLGFIIETENRMISRTSVALFLPVRMIGKLLSKRSRSARITALSLLISSHISTRPFGQATLRLLKSKLENFLADPDADFRSDVFSMFQKLIDRIRAITAVLARQSNRVPSIVNEIEQKCQASQVFLLEYHKVFLRWLLRLLTWMLEPTANYQKHISALQCLLILVKSGVDPNVPSQFFSKSALGETRWAFHVHTCTSELERLLLDLLLDPFDDVRQTSAAILRIYYSSSNPVAGGDYLRSTLRRAEAIMKATGRADQADGFAHAWALYCRQSTGRQGNDTSSAAETAKLLSDVHLKLDRILGIARTNLSTAVKGYPLHGLLIGLRYALIQDSMHLTNDHRLIIIKRLEEIWIVIKPVLCNDAPEGFTLDGIDDTSESTKETLSYCWRALKEASLLLNALVQQSLTEDKLTERICSLCFTQLRDLRHRGAFSTVAQTWISCCIRSQSLQSPSGERLIEPWYSRITEMLRNNVTINTRRSAGLPSLICGILIADNQNKLMLRAITDLDVVSRSSIDAKLAEEGSLAQVHAMNCIKDILKNTRLAEKSERYIPNALHLAADALRSDTWAIRNCGLMLFRAVTDRLLGTSELYLDDFATGRKRISAKRHPQLLDVINGLLTQESSLTESQESLRYEGVFPALQLLQHTDVPENRIGDVRYAIQRLISNPSWHLRDRSAKTNASFAFQGAQDLEDLLISNAISQNALHGSLLAAKYIVIETRLAHQKRSNSADGSRDDNTTLAKDYFDLVISQIPAFLTGKRCCLVTQAAFIDLIRECLVFLAVRSASQTHSLDLVGALLEVHSTKILGRKNFKIVCAEFSKVPGFAVLLQALGRFFAVQIAWINDDHIREEPVPEETVLALAREDEDACCYLLEELDDLHWLMDSVAKKCAGHACQSIISSGFGVKLKSAAQSTLLSLLAKDDQNNCPTSWVDCDINTTDYSGETGINQEYVDRALQLQGVYLDHRIATEQIATPDFSNAIVQWTTACVSAVANSGINTREAAVYALHRCKHLWGALALREKLHSYFLRLCIAIYDLLVDDDEDIRNLAAEITQRIAATSGKIHAADVEPITAGSKLLTFCVKQWPRNLHLAIQAAVRAFGISEPNWTSVSEQLLSLTWNDTALFAVEKQNLYIDEVREAWVWSRMLMRLSPAALPKAMIKKLGHWAADGLTALADRGKSEIDGPLGWTSKPEVFTLGMRVIYGTEVLFSLVERNRRIPVAPSQLRKKLYDFINVSKASGVNFFWCSEAERVLSESVSHKLLKIGERIGGLI